MEKKSTLCDFRQVEEDSNEHMLIHCEVVKRLAESRVVSLIML